MWLRSFISRSKFSTSSFLHLLTNLKYFHPRRFKNLFIVQLIMGKFSLLWKIEWRVEIQCVLREIYSVICGQSRVVCEWVKKYKKRSTHHSFIHKSDYEHATEITLVWMSLQHENYSWIIKILRGWLKLCDKRHMLIQLIEDFEVSIEYWKEN